MVVEIPWKNLSDDALQGVMEEFASRDGTDYGFNESSLEQKVANLKKQIVEQSIVIVYDDETDSCQLLKKEDKPEY